MATQDPQPTRFEDIDWSEVSGSTRDFSLSIQTKGFIAFLGLMLALLVYDYLVVPTNEPTFGAVGWEYSVSQLDWMFAITIAFMAAFFIVPLYQNPRMTKYYWDRFRENRLAVASLIYLGLIFFIGLIAPVFIAKPEISVLTQFQPPVFMSVKSQVVVDCVGRIANGRCYGSWQFPFGTTSNGKDLLRIIIYGMQVSMKVGLMASFIVMIIGSLVGTVAAYAGGIVDEILMRYVDIQQTFPSFLLFLLMTYLFGSSLFLFILIFGFFTWGNNARYVRSNALQKTEEEYIQAAKATGASTWLIIRRHLVPNTASSIVTDLTLLIPSFILTEAAFAFLGLGDPTVPSWGQAIADGRSSLGYAPWISTIPGIFLFATILAFNFLGDALLDAINPQAETESEGE
jgi:peptide/nickel transport system permease protein